ncbi:MAG TPA: PQQ-binding-like beta-propeller repeat protein [Planctomycetaceae bacterium]|nr:PQQ-binding-like beta-propeller repeat protein [Planctomycetaceae bacterium]
MPAATSRSFAADWPFLRGPSFDGSSPETGLTNWGDKPPRIVWTYPLGQGYSACIVGEGRVYTQYQDAWGQYLLALRLSDGQLLWKNKYAAPYDAVSIYPGPRSTPTYADGRVYYTTPHGEVACVRADSGEPIWSKPLWRELHGRGAEFGYAASPLVWRDLVVLPIGGDGAAVVALDRTDGHIVWKIGEGEASYCSILPIEASGKPLFVAYLQNKILIVDPLEPKVLWDHELSTGYDEHSAWPLFYSERSSLIFSAPFQAGAQAYQLSAGTPLSVKAGWASGKLSNDTASSVLVGREIYGFDLRDPQAKAQRPSRGEFRCLDVWTGAVIWSSDQPGHATIAAADGKLWLLSDRGELLAIAAKPQRYEELGRMTVFTDEICWTPPTISEGRLLVRSHGEMVCLGIRAESEATSDVAPPARTRRFVFHWHWLLNGEREHPFMEPDARELSAWFLEGLVLALLPMSCLAGVIRLVWRKADLGLLICGLTVLAGLIATPLANMVRDDFAFMWPVSLAAAQFAAFYASNRYQADTKNRRLAWQARLVGLGFLTLAAGYFLVLRALSEPREWVFLCGSLPATVVIWPLARRAVRTGSIRWLLGGLWVGYVVLFWGAVAFDWLR